MLLLRKRVTMLDHLALYFRYRTAYSISVRRIRQQLNPRMAACGILAVMFDDCSALSGFVGHLDMRVASGKFSQQH